MINKIIKICLKFISLFGLTKKVNTSYGAFVFPIEDNFISEIVKRENGFHQDRVELARKILRDQNKKLDSFLNLGANVGVVGIDLIINQNMKKGVLIEPDPMNFKCLEKNISYFKLSESLRSIQCAIGSKNESLYLYQAWGNTGDHTLSDRAKDVNTKTRIKTKVIVKTIDKMLEDCSEKINFDLIIMDIQGFEKEALEGSPNFWSKNIPLITEYDKRYLSEAEIIEVTNLYSKYYQNFWDISSSDPIIRKIVDIPVYLEGYSEYIDLLLV